MKAPQFGAKSLTYSGIDNGTIFEQELILERMTEYRSVGFCVATHKDEAVGTLHAQLIGGSRQRVLAEQTFQLDALADNSLVYLHFAQPVVGDGGPGLLRLTCSKQEDARFCSFYAEPGTPKWPRSGLTINGVPAERGLRLAWQGLPVTAAAARLATMAGDPAVPGRIDFVFDAALVGWLTPSPQGALWRCGEDGTLETGSVDMGFRGDIVLAGAAGPGGGFVGRTPVGRPASLVDDRVVFLQATDPLALAGPTLSHPARRQTFSSAALNAFLRQSTVTPLQSSGDIQHKIRANPRAAIFALHHSRHGLFKHQVAIASALRELGYLVITVNSSLDVDHATAKQIQALSDATILWAGQGSDFSSWLLSIASMGPAFAHLQELLLVNDSCVGPLSDLRPLFARMAATDADAWALTDSWETAYHLQSFLLVLRGTALHSVAFHNWMTTYAFPVGKDEIVQRGEIGLSQALIKGGLALRAAFPYPDLVGQWARDYWERRRAVGAEPLDPARYDPLAAEGAALWDRVRSGYPVNPMSYFGEQLVMHYGCPFLKKEHFIRDTRASRWLDMVRLCSHLQATRPEALDMITDAARSQAANVVAPIGVHLAGLFTGDGAPGQR